MFKTPTRLSTHELVEKRSRFITYCECVQNEQEFKIFLSRLKHKYPDARHYCYGFRIGPLNSAHRGFSDDGEPSGTAGMPILNVIDHSEFSNVAIVVVRYFGGTKLGTGGLARAYSDAAKIILDRVTWRIFEEQQEIKLLCTFQQEHQLRYLISQLEGNILKVDYQEEVVLTISVTKGIDLSSISFYRIDIGNS
jgi:uncharacterized YigZ family protein